MRLEDAPQIGNYRLLVRLGQGAMGDVHLALAQGPQGFAKLSVLKVLRRHLAEDPDFVAMFLEEGRLAMRLAHPNIVQTYEVGEDGQTHFLAMEYLEGQTLATALNRLGRDNPKLGFAEQAYVLCEVLAAVEYAHEYLDYDGSPLGIIHRDLSPPNVFLTYDGRVKVLDFGIAKALDSAIDTKTGLILGKTAYMAPEQALGRELTPLADVYSVGVMLWEAAAGRRRWEGTAEAGIVASLVGDDFIELPGAAERGLPRRVDEIVARALARDPADRYPSARALREDLEQLLPELGPPLDLRSIGRTVADAFEHERARMRGEVERLLADYKPSTEAAGAVSGAPRSVEQGATLPSLGPGKPDETSLRPLATGASRIVAIGSSHRKLLAALALAGIVIGLVLLINGSLRESSSPKVVASVAPAKASVHLRLEVFPRESTLYLDGARLSGNPVEIERQLDDQFHVLRAELEGFEPATRSFRFEHDTTVSLDLKPMREPQTAPVAPPPQPTVSRERVSGPSTKPAPSASPTAHETHAEPRPADSAADSKKKPSVKIDLGNPW